jgi:BlaI family transcriptional regulator, penicillinase repressor
MERLTKAEEELMLMIWTHGPSTVSDLIEQMPDPKPPHSSVSTIVRILEKKGYVDHRETGRSFEYFALLERKKYAGSRLQQLSSFFFGGSAKGLVSHLVQQEKLDISELEELLAELKKADEQKNLNNQK